MNAFAKLYSTCITNRLNILATEKDLRAPAQCGFRPGFRLEDNCIMLSTIIQQARANGRTAYLLFIDLHKAYDSIPRDKLWKVLLDSLQLPADIVKALQLSYCDLVAIVGEDVKRLFPSIPITIGLKQGCPISPILFTLFFDRIQNYIRNKLATLARADT